MQAVEGTGCVELPDGRASCTVTFDPDGSQLGLAVYFDQINGVWTANGTAPID